MTTDLDAIKARLREYDDALPGCPQKVARTVNYAPDFVAKDDPTRNDWNVTTYSPCCRPEGHEGECRNSRLILGWPGFDTLTALVAEIERLRSDHRTNSVEGFPTQTTKEPECQE